MGKNSVDVVKTEEDVREILNYMKEIETIKDDMEDKCSNIIENCETLSSYAGCEIDGSYSMYEGFNSYGTAIIIEEWFECKSNSSIASIQAAVNDVRSYLTELPAIYSEMITGISKIEEIADVIAEEIQEIKKVLEIEEIKEEEVYSVQAGDNLFRIAAAYGLTYQELAEYNDIEDPNYIEIGQVIKIPEKQEEDTTDSENSTDTEYSVQAGDNLFRIAAAAGLTVEELAEYNDIKDPDYIEIGQVIKIPSQEETISAEEAGISADNIAEVKDAILDKKDITLKAGQEFKIGNFASETIELTEDVTFSYNEETGKYEAVLSDGTKYEADPITFSNQVDASYTNEEYGNQVESVVINETKQKVALEDAEDLTVQAALDEKFDMNASQTATNNANKLAEVKDAILDKKDITLKAGQEFKVGNFASETVELTEDITFSYNKETGKYEAELSDGTKYEADPITFSNQVDASYTNEEYGNKIGSVVINESNQDAKDLSFQTALDEKLDLNASQPATNQTIATTEPITVEGTNYDGSSSGYSYQIDDNTIQMKNSENVIVAEQNLDTGNITVQDEAAYNQWTQDYQTDQLENFMSHLPTFPTETSTPETTTPSILDFQIDFTTESASTTTPEVSLPNFPDASELTNQLAQIKVDNFNQDLSQYNN